MPAVKSYLLVTIWAFCLVGTIAVGMMQWNAARHPLATRDPWMIGLLFGIPYAVLAFSGLFSFSRLWLLILHACVTALSFLLITLACYHNMDETISMLNAQAAGRRTMNCSLPLWFIVMLLPYGMSFIMMLVGMMLVPGSDGLRGSPLERP